MGRERGIERGTEEGERKEGVGWGNERARLTMPARSEGVQVRGLSSRSWAAHHCIRNGGETTRARAGRIGREHELGRGGGGTWRDRKGGNDGRRKY